MNLGQISEHVQTRSGRFDLDEVDVAGIKKIYHYINEACERLDLIVEHADLDVVWLKELAIGDYLVELQNVRYLKSVRIATAAGISVDTECYTTRLEMKENSILRQMYPEPFADRTQGQPRYYSRDPIHLAPEQSTLTQAQIDAIAGSDGVLENPTQHVSGFLVMPPADQAYTLRLTGVPFTKTLTASSDLNFWTVRHPMLLIKATMLVIEFDLRNSAGASDFEKAIDALVHGLRCDEVSATIGELPMEMPG